MLQLSRVVVLGAALAACGSPGSFNGAVDGKKFSVKSSAFALFTPPVPPVAPGTGGSVSLTGPVALVALSDSADICADAKAGKLAANRSYFVLSLAKLDLASQTLVAPAPGTYVGVDAQSSTASAAAAAAAGGLAGGYLLAGDGSCVNALSADAATIASGTVTVSELSAKSGGAARGDYSVSVGSQNSAVSGSFDAPFCAALGAFVQTAMGSSAPPCH